MAFDSPPDAVSVHLWAGPDAAASTWRTRIVVRRELHGPTAQRLTAAVNRALTTAEVDRVEVELAEVSSAGAAGVRALTACQEAADRAGIPLVLLDPAPIVLRSLRAAGLLARFIVVDDLPAGVPPGHADLQEWRIRSARVRRQARDLRLRARTAVDRSRSLRETGG